MAYVWFQLLSKEIKAIGFKQLENDSCLYYNRSKDTIIIVYIDDITIIGPETSYIKEIIQKLGQKFTITDLGPIRKYLRIDITWSKDLKTTNLS